MAISDRPFIAIGEFRIWAAIAHSICRDIRNCLNTFECRLSNFAHDCEPKIADGKAKPCILTTSGLEFMKNMPQNDQMPKFEIKTLRADDYPTWSQRRRALFRMLLKN